MFKFSAIILGGTLLLLTGCDTTPRHASGPPPLVWSLTNSVATPAPPANPHLARHPLKLGATPTSQNPAPAPKTSPATNAPVWTSLDQWAAANKLAAPRPVSVSPVASYAITSPKGTLVLEIGSCEATWRGLEIWLGFAPEMIDGQVFVYSLDLEKNLKPLLLDPPLKFKPGRVIVIDPGHGGRNSGTHSVLDGRFEKEFTLDWAKRLKPLLEKEGWTVYLTRTSDVYVTNADRPVFATAHHADAYISLHFNSAAPSKDQNGLEIYCLTPTGMPSTLTRGYEDRVTDHFPGNAFDAQNLQLAARLQTALVRGSGEEDRGVRRARFMEVLLDQHCPAVLIEGGFLSNPAEAKKIESPEFQEKLAEAVAKALK